MLALLCFWLAFWSDCNVIYTYTVAWLDTRLATHGTDVGLYTGFYLSCDTFMVVAYFLFTSFSNDSVLAVQSIFFSFIIKCICYNSLLDLVALISNVIKQVMYKCEGLHVLFLGYFYENCVVWFELKITNMLIDNTYSFAFVRTHLCTLFGYHDRTIFSVHCSR